MHSSSPRSHSSALHHVPLRQKQAILSWCHMLHILPKMIQAICQKCDVDLNPGCSHCYPVAPQSSAVCYTNTLLLVLHCSIAVLHSNPLTGTNSMALVHPPRALLVPNPSSCQPQSPCTCPNHGSHAVSVTFPTLPTNTLCNCTGPSDLDAAPPDLDTAPSFPLDPAPSILLWPPPLTFTQKVTLRTPSPSKALSHTERARLKSF